ncbi:MAG: NADH-quinone oxidoreductase subunit N, partial [Chloroflexota bacterium]
MDLGLVVPELLLTAFAFVIFTVDLLGSRKRGLGYLGALLLVVLLVVTVLQTGTGELSSGLYLVDTYTHFFRVFFPATTLFVVLFSIDYVAKRLRYPGEYYSLLLLATLGMVLMAGAGELVTAYVSLELVNFCLYVLAAYAKFDNKSNEAGVKYIILSVAASALLLLGIGYLYGMTGSTTFREIAAALAQQGWSAGTLVGLVLIAAGLGFKVAAVPFHMWTPDVYEGAPTPVTAFVSVASKAAGFVLLIRLFSLGLMPAIESWGPLLQLLAAVTMTVGNLLAIQQRNIRRLLAYSSIGQAGYLLMGAAFLSESTVNGILLHLVGYTFTGLAVFLCVTVYQNLTGAEELEGYAGMAQRSPLLALGMTMSLFSLAGLPLFAGFIANLRAARAAD